MTADEEAQILAVEHSADGVVLFDDFDLRFDPQRVGDVLEQIAKLIGGLAHRRLPERFFFLRGGAGGGPAGRP